MVVGVVVGVGRTRGELLESNDDKCHGNYPKKNV